MTRGYKGSAIITSFHRIYTFENTSQNREIEGLKWMWKTLQNEVDFDLRKEPIHARALRSGPKSGSHG